MVRLGRLLAMWPSLAEQALAGRVGVPQMRVLEELSANPRVREHLAEGETVLVQAALDVDFDDFVRVVAQWESLADPDGTELSVSKRRPVGVNLHKRILGGAHRLWFHTCSFLCSLVPGLACCLVENDG